MRIRAMILGAAAFMATVAASGAAAAQSACAPRAEVLEILRSRYGEAVVAGGVTTKGALLEVVASADGGTWTLIATSPAGVSATAWTLRVVPLPHLVLYGPTWVSPARESWIRTGLGRGRNGSPTPRSK